nr:CAP domain-containing protein [Sphingomicrobium sp. B8]
MVARHNEERARWGAAPLGWDDALAADAKAYATRLAVREEMVHDQSIRGVQGENLWSGTRDAFGYEQMIQAMIDERAMFRPGLFPDVSTSGRWQDVAHYTQMIWPTTTRLGCATTRGLFREYLVCRYAPAGNIRGRPVGGFVPPAPDEE